MPQGPVPPVRYGLLRGDVLEDPVRERSPRAQGR
jgi:hypothetical protein